jgi:hypothetical protein
LRIRAIAIRHEYAPGVRAFNTELPKLTQGRGDTLQKNPHRTRAPEIGGGRGPSSRVVSDGAGGVPG